MTTQNSNVPFKISSTLLLSIYAVPLFFFLLIFVDINFLSSFFALNLGNFNEELFFIIFVLIETPHILLSYLGFGSYAYLKHYRFFAPIFFFLMGLGVIIINLGSYNGLSLFYIYLFLLSNYHFVMQHVGITKALARNSSKGYYLLALFGFIFIQLSFFFYFFGISFVPYIYYQAILVSCIVGFFFTSCYLSFKSKTNIGRYYLHANTIMYLAFILFPVLGLGYSFLIILTMRILHDITATVFYLSHAKSYAKKNKDNFLLNIINLLPFPTIVSTILFTLILTISLFYLTRYLGFLALILMFMSLGHYLFENIIWKHGSPHRKEISF